jgi:ketosteroid isomerase-like protein
MSKENVAVTRRAVDAFNRRDLDALLETIDPQGELLPFRALLEGEPYRGHDGIRQFLEDMNDDWTELQIEVEEFRDSGDYVVAIGHVHARGRGSGVEIDAPAAFVAQLRKGKTVRFQSYTDVDQALEDAGIGD